MDEKNNTSGQSDFHRNSVSQRRGRPTIARIHSGETFVPPITESEAGAEHTEKRYRQESSLKRLPRKKKKRKIRRRRYALLPAFAVLLIFAVWLFLRLASVPFGSIIVEGNEKMQTEDVCHIAVGDSVINVIQLSPDLMQDKLSHDMRINDVKVSREFPATIRISMSERKAEAVVTTMYGFAYIDPKGLVMDLEPQIKGVSVPLLTGKKMDSLLLGDTITDNTIRLALTYLANLSPEGKHEIIEINVGNPEEIIAYTGNAISIRLGSGNDMEQRAKITEELLKEVQTSNISVQYVDTDVQSPFVKSK